MQRIWTVLLAVYGIFGTLMAASSVPESLVSVSRYKLNVLWFMPETSHARLDALLIDGHIRLFELYNSLENFSFFFLFIASLFGLYWGYKDTFAKRLFKTKSFFIITFSLALLYGLNKGLQASIDALAHSGHVMNLGLSAMPLYWLVGLICSAAFTGHYVATGAHDLALVLREKSNAQKI